jgi:hypothetical protein
VRRGGLNHTHASSLLLTRCRVGLARRGNEVRTMQHRIDELNVIALAEQPPRQVRDVRGCGACFFLALSLAIGEVRPHTRVADEDALDEAGLSSRRDVVARMRALLDEPCGSDLRQQMELAEIPGSGGTAEAYLAYM